MSVPYNCNSILIIFNMFFSFSSYHIITSNGNPHIFVDMVPLLNGECLNVVKVVSISMGIGVAKAILIFIIAISSSCDFWLVLLCFLKVCDRMHVLFVWIFVFLKTIIRLMQIDAEFQELFDHLFSKTDIDEYIDFDIEVVISLPAIGLLKIERGQETRNKSIAEVIEMTMVLPRKPISPKRSQK